MKTQFRASFRQASMRNIDIDTLVLLWLLVQFTERPKSQLQWLMSNVGNP